ncbi:MAG: hypothetical protein EOP45_17530 [Sphingobacteriaceae bacterium]|nr:MAG: hypothetical protein EOP45_17530 [Sphingobacteriaceae bacterium]
MGIKIKKRFHCQIQTDSVAVSVLYTNPPSNAVETSKEDQQKAHYAEIRDHYEHNEYFYEIPIDPGDKTHIAAVRRNVLTGVEVSDLKILNKCTYFESIVMFI